MDETEITWSTRVPKRKIRRLYLNAGQGIYDDTIVDDVGLTLYLRCRDILNIFRARGERIVTCPRCLQQDTQSDIPYAGKDSDALACSVCGWQSTWLAYRKTFQHRQLHAGGAVVHFQDYVQSYDRAATAKARAIAIDRLIHEFHHSLLGDPDRLIRSAAVNLIEGTLMDVVVFLDELNGVGLPPEMQGTRQEWRRKQERISDTWTDKNSLRFKGNSLESLTS